MEVGGQHDNPAALPLGNKPITWSLIRSGRVWSRGTSLALPGIEPRTDRLVASRYSAYAVQAFRCFDKRC